MSGGQGGIGNDISGGLNIASGAALALMGAPQIGVPIMLGGANSFLGGGQQGGNMSGLGSIGTGLGSLLGGPAGGSQQAPAQASPPAMAAPSTMGGIAAPPAPTGLSPAGGGAQPGGSATLSPMGGGPIPNVADYAAIGGPMSGATPPMAAQQQQDIANNLQQGTIQNQLQSGLGSGANPSTPWYKDPTFWQGTGSVGTAYLKYLAEQQKTEFAHPFSSTVVPQPGTIAALGQPQRAPITPPQLNI